MFSSGEIAIFQPPAQLGLEKLFLNPETMKILFDLI